MMKISPEVPGEYCIVSCGMLRPEMEHLIKTGFLNPIRMFYTPPGLHALPDRLEQQLLKRLDQARRLCPDDRIVVSFGESCYINPKRPSKSIDSMLREAGGDVVRVEGEYGYDMLSNMQERRRIGGGDPERTLWFTAGWLKNWKLVYQEYFGWDRADANANFPGYYDRIVVIDALGLEKEYSTDKAETILEIFDWTGLEVEFYPITIDRFKRLLKKAITRQ